jgi:CelD/BcsL family acetyltransferase involved in cellulose biosynthesis
VRVSLIHPSELGESEIAAWHSMQRATPSLDNPYLSPEFSMAVGRFRPDARVAILTEGQSITGFFPFEKRRLGIGVPICGWINPCHGMIHALGADWDARELLHGCGLSAWRFDCLIADQKPFAAYHSVIAQSAMIDLSGGHEAYYEKLRDNSPRFCTEIARRTRKLEREFGELRIVAGSPDISVLHSLLAWKSEQYRRTGHVDRFEQHWLVELLEVLLATRSTHLTGLLSSLYAGDQLVAAQFGLRTENLFVGWFTGYEASFGKYSPGLIHIKGLAQEMATAGIRTIDMGGGAKNYYKEKMKSYNSLIARGVVTSRSTLGEFYRVRNVMITTARRTAHEHPALDSAIDHALRLSGLSRRIWGQI